MILIGGVSRCSCRSNEEWYPKPAPQQSNSNYKSLSRQEKEFKEPKGDKIEYHDEICLYCSGSGRIICSNCKGTGYYNEKCSSCNGRGENTVECSYLEPDINSGKLISKEGSKTVLCHSCLGKGYIERNCSFCYKDPMLNLTYTKCTVCGGRGKLTK